jgi:hypothetical protein
MATSPRCGRDHRGRSGLAPGSTSRGLGRAGAIRSARDRNLVPDFWYQAVRQVAPSARADRAPRPWPAARSRCRALAATAGFHATERSQGRTSQSPESVEFGHSDPAVATAGSGVPGHPSARITRTCPPGIPARHNQAWMGLAELATTQLRMDYAFAAKDAGIIDAVFGRGTHVSVIAVSPMLAIPLHRLPRALMARPLSASAGAWLRRAGLSPGRPGRRGR